MTAKDRPALRYHGGKWMLAPWIISHFPAHRVYVEPFGGGASVLLRKPRAYAEVYNDLDGEVVNLFRVLQNQTQAQELHRLLILTPFAREEFELSYTRTDEPIEWARRTIIRSFMGFGSDGVNDERPTGFRANSNRSGTTPAHDWANYPQQIERLTARLAGVVIENRDALEVIAQHDGKETLFYVDPPYLHTTRTNSKRYRYEMTDAQHEQLADVLGQVQGMVIVSGYPSELYERLFEGWIRKDKTTFADGALPRVESLWMRNVRVQKELF